MSRSLVVDASVAIKWFFDEGDSEHAADVAACGADLIAPSLLRAELANGLWKKYRQRLVSLEVALSIWSRMPDFFRALVPTEELMTEALAMAFRLDHPVYDCAYLALARRNSATLVTADKRLIAKVRTAEPNVEVIALDEWSAP